METQSDCMELKLGTYRIGQQTIKSDDRFRVVSEVTSHFKIDEEIATSLPILAHLIAIGRIYKDKDVSIEEASERVTDALKKILEAEAEGKINYEKMPLFK